MSNNIYNEKKDFYRNSNVSLTREIAKNYDHWDREAIKDRTAKLAQELIQIFPMPDIKEVSEREITGEYTIDQTVNVTGTKPILITISEKEYPVKSWRQMLITFLNDIWNKDSHNYELIKKNAQLGQTLFNKNLRNSAKLENGINIETNFSASYIVDIIAKISKICDITDQVSYTVK